MVIGWDRDRGITIHTNHTKIGQKKTKTAGEDHWTWRGDNHTTTFSGNTNIKNATDPSFLHLTQLAGRMTLMRLDLPTQAVKRNQANRQLKMCTPSAYMHAN